jgi:hypothetical protein
MDNRIRLRASALPLIRTGETVQAVFRAQSVSPYFRWPPILPNAYWVVVVTDQRILVCKAGAFRPTIVRGIAQELTRETRIGKPRGFWWRCDSLGERLYVHRQFHDEVVKADYELFTSP